MMNKYSVKRISQRWPLNVFFVLVNISCVNFFVLDSQKQRIKQNDLRFIKRNVSMKLLEDTPKRRF